MARKATIKIRIKDVIQDEAESLWYAKYKGKFLEVSEPSAREPLHEHYYEFHGFNDQKIIFKTDTQTI